MTATDIVIDEQDIIIVFKPIKGLNILYKMFF